jgi:hypothetical protein
MRILNYGCTSIAALAGPATGRSRGTAPGRAVQPGQGLASAEEAIFDLDFHAVMHWGSDPALEKHYVPTRSQRARSVLTFFA